MPIQILPYQKQDAVVSLTRADGIVGWTVTIEVGTFAEPVRYSIPVPAEDPTQAVEMARIEFVAICRSLAETFAAPGSLK